MTKFFSRLLQLFRKTKLQGPQPYPPVIIPPSLAMRTRGRSLTPPSGIPTPDAQDSSPEYLFYANGMPKDPSFMAFLDARTNPAHDLSEDQQRDLQAMFNGDIPTEPEVVDTFSEPRA